MTPLKKVFVYIGLPILVALIVGGIVWAVMSSRDNDDASSVVLDGSRKKLVIDHDGGADDAVAITMALLYEKYFDGPYVVGLTTTFGNVNLSQVLINTERILDLCDRNDVPIYSGAEGPLINGIESDYFFGYDGLGDDGYQHGRPVKIEKLHSALALIELSKKYEGDLIVVVIGPATNIALAIRLDPDFMGRISQIYLGGGYVPNIAFPDAEFNVGMDPEAYYIVVDAAKVSKTTFVPFSQIKYSMIIEKEWRKNILGAIQTPIVQALNGYERLSLAVTEDWSTLDPAVVAIVLNSNITEEYKTSNCSVSLCDQHGVTEFDFTSPEPNTRVFYRGNVETYKKFLIDVYSAELNTY